AAFPQWLVIDMGTPTPVNAIRIAWAAPYARTYHMQYFTGEDAMRLPAKGEWRNFAAGNVIHAAGGTVTHRLATLPVNARFVRVSMWDSSETCDTHGGSDRRNCVGYAIHEVGLGMMTSDGEFKDFVHHSPD